MCPAVAGEKRRQYYLSSEHKSSLRYKVCLFMIIYYRKLLGVDPDNVHQVLLSSNTFRKRKRAEEQSRQRLKIKQIWPIVVLAIYILITVQWCAYMYYKFQQDSYRFRQDRLMRSIKFMNATTSPRTNTNTTSLIESRLVEYSDKLRWSRMRLKQLGDPYIEAQFIIQVADVAILATTLLAFLLPQILANYTRKFQYFLARVLAHEPEEYFHCQQLIDLELRRLANSSRNFISWTLELAKQGSSKCNAHVYEQLESFRKQTQYDLANSSTRSRVRILSHRGSTTLLKTDGLARYIEDHRRLTKQLLQLRRSNRLHPMNRVSEEWLSRNELQFVTFSITNTVCSLFLDTVFIYVGHLFTNYKLEFATFTDMLMIVELYFYCIINIFGTNYHMQSVIIAVDNRTRYLNHMRQQLIDCIRDNDRKFESLHKSLTANNYHRQYNVDQIGVAEKELFETCSNDLNSRVIEVYLQYRIFMEDLVELNEYWFLSIPVAMALMFITPVFARVYIPYITEMNANIGVLIYVFTLAIFVNIFMTPLCKFSKYGESTYKTMCSLLAHCVELQVKSREELPHGPIYMEHLIGVLTKELDDPHEFLGKFSSSWLGITATFSTLVQWHVYYGLLIISLFCEITSWRTLFGDRLDDPFALLKT